MVGPQDPPAGGTVRSNPHYAKATRGEYATEVNRRNTTTSVIRPRRKELEKEWLVRTRLRARLRRAK